MKFLGIVLFFAIENVHAEFQQSAFPIIGGAAILNSIIETITSGTTRNQPNADQQEIAAVLFDQGIFNDNNFKNDVADLTNNLNNEIVRLLQIRKIPKGHKAKIDSLIPMLVHEALATGKEMHDRGSTKQRDIKFLRIFRGMLYIAQMLNDINTKIYNVGNSTIIDKANEGSTLINFNEKLNEFVDAIGKIDDSYRRFMQYCGDIEVMVFNQSLREFANDINSTISTLNNVQTSFGKENTLLQSILEQEVSKSIVCAKRRTPQQLVYGLYQNAVITELKGLMILSFANAVQSYFDQGTSGNIAENLAKDTLVRVNSLNTIVTAFLGGKKLEREFYRCGLPSLNDDDEYYQYKNFLQTVLVESRTYGKNHKVLLDHKKCNGTLFGCNPVGSWASPKACLSHSKSRRYDYLHFEKRDAGKISNAEIKYGTKCAKPVPIPVDKTYGICLCDESKATQKERYISLDTVTSDKQNDMVVIGVKMINHTNGVRFQIQQATLSPGGSVNTSTAHWVDGGKSDIKNRFEMRHNRRRIDIDVFNGEPGYLMTGVKFSSLKDGVTVQVEITAFNKTTGKLDGNNVKWLNNKNSIRQREAISLVNMYQPGVAKSGSNVYSSTNQFIEFSTTGLTEDVGQTTIPFFDTRPVSSDSLAPLSGLGLQYKSAGTRHGGFLAPVVVGLNYAEYIEEEVPDVIPSLNMEKIEEVKQSETTADFNISDTTSDFNISETTAEFNISETTADFNISETSSDMKISETAEDVKISEQQLITSSSGQRKSGMSTFVYAFVFILYMYASNLHSW